MRTLGFVFLMIMAAPAFSFQYHGDGVFTDRGILTGFDRYRLELPPVNLCKTGEYVFDIGELPAAAMSLGLEYTYPINMDKDSAYKLSQEMSSNLLIYFKLEKADSKKTIYEYDGPVYEDGYKNGKLWTRGFRGMVWREKIIFFVDEVRFYSGMFWQHHPAMTLTFEIKKPMQLQNCSANFVIKGGGWK